MINPTSAADVQAILNQIKEYQSQASAGVSIDPSLGASASAVEKIPGSFSSVVESAVKEVNQTQAAAKQMRTAYERGEEIPLTDVVLGMQKSSLAFEATLQVRNKVLKAYEEVMNMPV